MRTRLTTPPWLRGSVSPCLCEKPKRPIQFGESLASTPALHLTFGGGDWQKITTKDTKSVKLEFDDFFNRVIGCAIKFHRCNNSRAEVSHLAFLSSDSLALFVVE